MLAVLPAAAQGRVHACQLRVLLRLAREGRAGASVSRYSPPYNPVIYDMEETMLSKAKRSD